MSKLTTSITCVLAGRLNWQLHFGDPPKWSSNVKFILVDVEPSKRDADKAALVLKGDAAAVAQQLGSALRGLDTNRSAQWRQQLAQKASQPPIRAPERPCVMPHANDDWVNCSKTVSLKQQGTFPRPCLEISLDT